MEKKISLLTIQQIIYLRLFSRAEEIVKRLMKKIDKMDELDLKKEISQIIIEQKE